MRVEPQQVVEENTCLHEERGRFGAPKGRVRGTLTMRRPEGETQAMLHALVEQEPGLSVDVVAARMGLSSSTAAYHVRHLCRERRLVAERFGRALALFPANRGWTPERRNEAMLPPLVRQVVAAIGGEELRARELAARLPSAGVRSVQEAVRMAVRLGLLQRTQYGKYARVASEG